MRFLIVTLFILFGASLIAQEKGNVKGIILDKEMESEPLAFASVSVKDAKIATQTDFDGNFFLNLDKGTYTLVVAFVGYEKIEIPDVKIDADNTLSLGKIAIGALKLAHNNMPSTTIASSAKM